MNSIVLTCRRVVTLSGARASIHPLARCWGAVIHGYIGHYKYASCEEYATREMARERCRSVNKHQRAIVASIEITLFPTGVASFKSISAELIPSDKTNRNLGFKQ